jgi:D-methionine transport system ATP-binding protein
VIALEHLTKVYGHGAEAVRVLQDLDFRVDSGEIFAVVGPSGAGKSTLAQCVALLEQPTSGRVIVNGEELTGLPEHRLRVARRRIGSIFQSDGLFSRRTAAENVALPLEYLGVTRRASDARVAELLDRVGLLDRANAYPHQLSGGQRQRVGIARALALKPTVLLSDEATSGLDPEATASIVRLLRELRTELDLAVLFITHEMETVVQVADAVARLDGGRIVESGRVVDLLRDPVSRLGAALRPARSAGASSTNDRRWRLTYTSAAVPAEWPALLGDAIGAPISLLAASIEQIDGVPVGTATVAAPAGLDLTVPAARLGLDARVPVLVPEVVS